MDKVSISEISGHVLNQQGQFDVAELLEDNEIEQAKYYVLGAIDRLWEDGELTDEEARKHYNKLGVPGETAAQLRQNRSV